MIVVFLIQRNLYLRWHLIKKISLEGFDIIEMLDFIKIQILNV